MAKNHTLESGHITPEITTWWTVSLDSIDQFILFLSPLYSRKDLVEAAHARLHLHSGSRCSLTGEWLPLKLGGTAAPTASWRPDSLEAQRRSGSIFISAAWQLPLQLESAESADGAAITRIDKPNPHAPCQRWRLFWLCGSLALPEAGGFPQQGRKW